MVKRYNMVIEGNPYECSDGPYVEYEDYAALELKVLAALSHLERAAEADNHVLCSGYARMSLRMLKDA